MFGFPPSDYPDYTATMGDILSLESFQVYPNGNPG
jgi:hypothetical protein